MKSNKLIAEFMDRAKTFNIVDNDINRGKVTLSEGLIKEQIESEISHFEERYSITPIAIEENLQYHTSWDWLMPVISKITRDIRWHGNKYREYLMDIVPLGNIEYAYSAVVDFIEEYNKYQNKDDEDDICSMLYGVDNNQ